MTQLEAEKKFHDPTIENPGEYGFALNSALSGKYLGDVKNPNTTILIYTSKNLQKNASGNPTADVAEPVRGGENLGITVSGEVIQNIANGYNFKRPD